MGQLDHSRDALGLTMSFAKLLPTFNAPSTAAALLLLLLLAAACGPLCFVRAERQKFRCDELEQTPISDDLFCTVSQMIVNFTTVVDCDVYPMERTKVRVIKFYSSHMLFIPAGLLRLFNDVRDMDISHSNVVDISRSSFEGAKHLVYLTMSHNEVVELRASIFVEALSLFMLDLSYNRIHTVDRFAFVNAQSMSRLNLGHNQIGELHISTFRDMKFLDQISLNDNRLTVIDPGLFAGNVHLQKIVLDNNRLLELDMTVFTKCSHLELIQVSGNLLTSINATVLPPKFKTLAVNNNSLTELYLNNNMEVLEASNNRIRSLVVDQPLAMRQLLLANNSLPDVANITAMEKLEVLDLSQNRIGRLGIHTLARLKSLSLLNLAQTGLRDLNYGSFSGQRDLKVLDLSYNGLNEIHLDILSPYMTRLERLHLDGNNLTDVGGLFQVHLPSLFPVLNTLGLSNNNFNCTYLTKIMRTLSSVKIKLPVDPEPSSGTHVAGIACSLESSAAAAAASSAGGDRAASTLRGDVGAYAHFAFRRAGDDDADDADSAAAGVDRPRNTWSQQKLMAAMNRYLLEPENRLEAEAELVALRGRFAASQSHEQLLRDNLFTLKLLVALLCIGGLAVVALKCVTFYRKNQHVWPIVPSLYRSTTTVNTLQCSMEATP